MTIVNSINDPAAVETLHDGGIVVLRTDTLYGIVAQADREQSVERIYRLKGRDEQKSPIVLISSINDLFDEPSAETRRFLESVWPGKVSVILPSTNAPDWIKRGNQSVAYRLPDDQELHELIRGVGPIVAPSANPEGASPALSIEEACEYFGEHVDVYVDGGRVEDDAPSRLIRLKPDGSTERLR